MIVNRVADLHAAREGFEADLAVHLKNAVTVVNINVCEGNAQKKAGVGGVRQRRQANDAQRPLVRTIEGSVSLYALPIHEPFSRDRLATVVDAHTRCAEAPARELPHTAVLTASRSPEILPSASARPAPASSATSTSWPARLRQAPRQDTRTLPTTCDLSTRSSPRARTEISQRQWQAYELARQLLEAIDADYAAGEFLVVVQFALMDEASHEDSGDVSYQ